MRLYLAGVGKYGDYLLGLDNLRFLVSYFYLRKAKAPEWHTVNFAIENDIPLMLDCGAWSAFNNDQEINNQEYIKFCKEHRSKFEVIVSLDVIGNYKATNTNHQEMKKAGINSLPTFHLGSPFDELEKLLEQENYIGIGGIATKGNQTIVKNWIKYVNHLANRHKFHGFGVTTPNLLKQHNWHSVDGTTWMTAAVRYGRLMINLGNGKFKWIAVNDQKQLEENWHLIKDDIESGWHLENGRTEKYEEVSLRYNAKSLLELVQYHSKNRVRQPKQEYLL